MSDVQDARDEMVRDHHRKQVDAFTAERDRLHELMRQLANEADEAGMERDDLRQTLTETEASYQAEVAALTAERDRLRAWSNRLMQLVPEEFGDDMPLPEPTLEPPPMVTQEEIIEVWVHRVVAERDRLREERIGHLGGMSRADALAAQLARERPVIEAAVQWQNSRALVEEYNLDGDEMHLDVVLDAYQATQEHPETYCHRCGDPNVSWTAPSPLWNAVMRGGDINGVELHDGIVCMACFAELAEAAQVATSWRLVAETVYAELQTVTPSGRVWDEQTWLWKETDR